jgi:DNA-binding GntR family transcriptional regulator
MSVVDDDPRAPYLQVADALRDEIASGVLRPGQKLASVRQMAERFGVSPMTVQNALRLLRESGLIFSSGNRGSFVQDVRVEPSGEREGDLTKTVENLTLELRRLSKRVSELESLLHSHHVTHDE